MKNLPFTYDGRSLVAQASEIQDGTEVQVYEGGNPIKGAIYSVRHPVDWDMIRSGYDPVGVLLEFARNDFIRWSDWIKENGAK